MDKKSFLAVSLILSCFLAFAQDQYKAEWESLQNYQAPEWYEDAKLGFWPIWGIYSVPAFMGEHATEWYGRHMYNPDGPGHHQHHVEKYGDPSEFGYKDFIPMWKAEKFDPDTWMDLCVEGGAKFFCTLAVFHDSYALWDSKLTQWNSVNMAPGRDIVKELGDAARKKGLKYGVSNHSAWNHAFFAFNHKNGYDAKDITNQDLYGNPEFLEDGKVIPSQRDVDRWLARTIELCDVAQPDLYYFDWGHRHERFEQGRKDFGAHYYNQAIALGKGTFGSPGVVLNYKKDYYAPGSAVLDLERGRLKTIHNMVWQTDDSIYDGHTWGYGEGVPIKPTNTIVDELIDVISKRGILMLAIAPKADGTFPEDQQQMLHELGSWLKINGEAVYATRTWKVLGEGPSVSEDIPYGKKIVYTPADIRFTRNKANTVLYATALEWPTDTMTIKSLKGYDLGTLRSVELLGSNEKLSWNQSSSGLQIKLGKKPNYDYAYPVKLVFDGQIPN